MLSKAARWDHPRACGEQHLYPFVQTKITGSSPRVRGADISLSCGVGSIGIIPARAGSSTATLTGSCLRGDHPRACGEQ